MTASSATPKALRYGLELTLPPPEPFVRGDLGVDGVKPPTAFAPFRGESDCLVQLGAALLSLGPGSEEEREHGRFLLRLRFGVIFADRESQALGQVGDGYGHPACRGKATGAIPVEQAFADESARETFNNHCVQGAATKRPRHHGQDPNEDLNILRADRARGRFRSIHFRRVARSCPLKSF